MVTASSPGAESNYGPHHGHKDDYCEFSYSGDIQTVHAVPFRLLDQVPDRRNERRLAPIFLKHVFPHGFIGPCRRIAALRNGRNIAP